MPRLASAFLKSTTLLTGVGWNMDQLVREKLKLFQSHVQHMASQKYSLKAMKQLKFHTLYIK